MELIGGGRRGEVDRSVRMILVLDLLEVGVDHDRFSRSLLSDQHDRLRVPTKETEMLFSFKINAMKQMKNYLSLFCNGVYQVFGTDTVYVGHQHRTKVDDG